jgi:hypothetical protein
MIPGSFTEGSDLILSAGFKALSMALSSGGEGFTAQFSGGTEAQTTPLLDEVRGMSVSSYLR